MMKLLSTAALISVGFLPMTTTPAAAQTYQIDCAILLCLSGGWPVSVPCARARAEFIRRITPWPIEPPLQIWRCPMSISHTADPDSLTADRIYEILLDTDEAPLQTYPIGPLTEFPIVAQPAVATRNGGTARALPDGFAVELAQQVGRGADVDISSADFDYIRSINVFHVRLNQSEDTDIDGRSSCNRSDIVRHGTYDAQGQFSWAGSSYSVLPVSFQGDEGFATNCPNVYVRSVFIDWTDFEGNYGYEQVYY